MHRTMKTFVTVIAGAAALALAASTVTYAATGDSLIGGHRNAAGKTTTLRNTGIGPALSLRSKGDAPSLAVSSKAVVKRLNASMVGGKTAAALSSNAVTYLGGGRGSQVGDTYVFTIKPGIYQVSLMAIVDGFDAPFEGFVQCFVGAADTPSAYVGSTAPFSTAYSAIASGSNVVRIRPGKTETIMGCSSDQNGLTLAEPVAFSAVKINRRTVTSAATRP
jgi:hypothetical protein